MILEFSQGRLVFSSILSAGFAVSFAARLQVVPVTGCGETNAGRTVECNRATFTRHCMSAPAAPRSVILQECARRVCLSLDRENVNLLTLVLTLLQVSVPTLIGIGWRSRSFIDDSHTRSTRSKHQAGVPVLQSSV